MTLADLAALTDVFTIGGTKNGALFGEAVVLNTPCPRFRWHMKQRGAVLAKGRLLGVQFQALLENGLYFEIARHANALASRLREGIAALGYEFGSDSPSNQQFPILPNCVVQALEERLETSLWIPEAPDLCGALGAALFALDSAKAGPG